MKRLEERWHRACGGMLRWRCCCCRCRAGLTAARSPTSPTRPCGATRRPCARCWQQNADVNAPQADGATALHWAVYRGDIGTGGPADSRRRERRRPRTARAPRRSGWRASTATPPSSRRCSKAGADPNEKLPLGRTPLMVASRTGNVEAMKVLLDHGADVNAKETLRGTTPLMWAADEGHAAAIKLLIERGADIKAQSSSGRARPRAGARQVERSAASRSRRRARRCAAGQASPPSGR